MQEKDRYKNGRRPIRKGNDMGKSQTENRIARAKVHTKVERYGKGSGSRPHGFPTDAIAGVSPIHNGAEVPYEKGRESECCRIRTKDRYKNGMKIHTKWERYEKKSGSRPHGIPAGAQAAASSIQNGAEVPYEKGIEMGKRCEAKQDRYKNDRKIDTKVARKGMRP